MKNSSHLWRSMTDKGFWGNDEALLISTGFLGDQEEKGYNN